MPYRVLWVIAFLSAAATVAAQAVPVTFYRASATLTYRLPEGDPETVRLLGFEPQPAVQVATGVSDSVLASAPETRVKAARAAARASGVPLDLVLSQTSVRAADPFAGRTGHLARGMRTLLVEARVSDRSSARAWVEAFAAELVRATARGDSIGASKLRQHARELRIVRDMEAANLAVADRTTSLVPMGPGRLRFTLVAALVAAWGAASIWWPLRGRQGPRQPRSPTSSRKPPVRRGPTARSA